MHENLFLVLLDDLLELMLAGGHNLCQLVLVDLVEVMVGRRLPKSSWLRVRGELDDEPR